jgi:hypothetical protein
MGRRKCATGRPRCPRSLPALTGSALDPLPTEAAKRLILSGGLLAIIGLLFRPSRDGLVPGVLHPGWRDHSPIPSHGERATPAVDELTKGEAARRSRVPPERIRRARRYEHNPYRLRPVRMRKPDSALSASLLLENPGLKCWMSSSKPCRRCRRSSSGREDLDHLETTRVMRAAAYQPHDIETVDRGQGDVEGDHRPHMNGRIEDHK